MGLFLLFWGTLNPLWGVLYIVVVPLVIFYPKFPEIVSDGDISIKRWLRFVTKKSLTFLLSMARHISLLAVEWVGKITVILITISLLTVFTLYLFTLPHGLVGQIALFVHAHAQANGMDFQSAYAVFSTALTACILIATGTFLLVIETLKIEVAEEDEDSTEGK